MPKSSVLLAVYQKTVPYFMIWFIFKKLFFTTPESLPLIFKFKAMLGPVWQPSSSYGLRPLIPYSDWEKNQALRSQLLILNVLRNFSFFRSKCSFLTIFLNFERTGLSFGKPNRPKSLIDIPNISQRSSLSIIGLIGTLFSNLGHSTPTSTSDLRPSTFDLQPPGVRC